MFTLNNNYVNIGTDVMYRFSKKMHELMNRDTMTTIDNELGLKLIDAISTNNEFSTTILIARILQNSTEEELNKFLCDTGLIDNNSCYFCEVKCDNEECDLTPTKKQ